MPKQPTRAARRKAKPRQRPNAARPNPKRASNESAAGSTLRRIADALAQIALALPGAAHQPTDAHSLATADAFVWNPAGRLTAVPRVSRVEIGLLKGIDRMRDILIENTERFAAGLPANNSLLWGARGMGKSSLVKAAHAAVNARADVAGALKLIEIHREDIESLLALMTSVSQSLFRFLVFCDALSF